MRGDVILDWGRRIGWGETGVGTRYLIGAVESGRHYRPGLRILILDLTI